MIGGFSKEDVLLMANHIMGWYPTYEQGDYAKYHGYCCEYCSGRPELDCSNFKHERDCIVLVAQDVLTGREPNE